MKETGIIMSGNHPKLILDGIKAMTRRVMKPQIQWLSEAWYWTHPKYDNGDGVNYFHSRQITPSVMGLIIGCCPYGQVGDRLWVREAFFLGGIKPNEWVAYRADTKQSVLEDYIWKPSIFMPRWASRILLEITEIRVERLQEISAVETEAEGIDVGFSNRFTIASDAIFNFQQLWDSLNAKRGYSWDTNCWVWVIGFKLL